MRSYLQTIAQGATLHRDEAASAMHHLLQGDASPEEIAAFLVGLRARGETLDELVGFATVMRSYAVPVRVTDPHAIDLCGTGGDGAGTFNISTTAALVCAGAGVTVVKHGNRAVSSSCGSADVLEALGVAIDLGPEGVEQCLDEAGIGFIFAPRYHPALRHVMPVRRKLGVRTFFNILGPLCNPAGVRRQLVGAFSLDMAETMAALLAELDAEHVVAVHAEDGLDELTLATGTTVLDRSGAAEAPVRRRVTPEDFGLAPAPLDAVQGRGADENARILQSVLGGNPGPHRDVVLLNAAFALYASGRFDSPEAGLEAARRSLDTGAARDRLQRLMAASTRAARLSHPTPSNA